MIIQPAPNSLLSPEELVQSLPSSFLVKEKIKQHRQTIAQILSGQDQRLIVILGPCSIHDSYAAIEYAEKLQAVRPRFEDKLLLVMRTYFEKPRTATGWRGLINDPYLDNSHDIMYGLHLARQLLLHINNLNIPCATEFLDSITPLYLSDLITWTAIGARTAESPLHRQIASGFNMPVGFKNNTDGNIDIAINAIKTAMQPQHYLNVGQNGYLQTIKTAGNAHAHLILRGGREHTNYQADKVIQAATLLKQANLNNKLIIDCSHGNSKKNYLNQIQVVDHLTQEFTQTKQMMAGIMLESHLIAGKQSLSTGTPLTYGQSITDACLSWNQTLVLLEKLALSL